MYPINRELTSGMRITTPIIKFFTQNYLEYFIGSDLVSQFLLITIHNYINCKGARYRYVEQIPNLIISLICYVVIACFACLITMFTCGQKLWKRCCINFFTQAILSIFLLYVSIIGSLYPARAINMSLFYGEKVMEILDRDRKQTKKVCDFVKNFWGFHRIRMQNWMLSAKKLAPENQLTYQMRVINASMRLKTLSDIKNLFQYALSAT